MKSFERLRAVAGQLTQGWSERIEYGIAVTLHGLACEGREPCDCRVMIEKRAERRWQAPLLEQLAAAQYAKPVGGDGGGGGGNKPGSRTPGNLERPDEILCGIAVAAFEHVSLNMITVTAPRRNGLVRTRIMLDALAEHPWPDDGEAAAAALADLSRPVRQARLMLGYDSPTVAFESTVCGNCGGALTVATDNPAAVRCAGSPAAPPCGTSYPWWQWPELVETAAYRIADTATAVAWIGRPREVLYRWAREGRVTRHGSSRRGEARWNLAELPQAIPGQPLPDPPEKKSRGCLDKTDKA